MIKKQIFKKKLFHLSNCNFRKIKYNYDYNKIMTQDFLIMRFKRFDNISVLRIYNEVRYGAKKSILYFTNQIFCECWYYFG